MSEVRSIFDQNHYKFVKLDFLIVRKRDMEKLAGGETHPLIPPISVTFRVLG